MILHTANDNVTVEQLAAEMVRLSMDRRESVCAVHKGIPLVTYPNDVRTREERIKLLTMSFMDSFLRSQMITYPIPAGQSYDTRFDPKFGCKLCEINECRERVLRETLDALAKLARKKMPGDEEILMLSSAAITVLEGTSLQKHMADSLGKLLRR